MGDRRFLDFARRPLVGLDIDSSGVRMVQLRRKNGQHVVTGAAASDVASWGADQDLHRKSTLQAIRQCLDTLGSSSKLAVCGLRGPEVVVRGFEFPTLPNEEVEGAVELEATQICPFGTEESTLDYQVTSNGEKRTRGFWVAATESLIASRRQLMHEAGLKCVLMDVDGLALLNCLKGSPGSTSQAHNTENDNRPVLVSVGEFYTSIAIANHTRRPFVRDVCSGDQDILHEIVRQTRLTPEAIRTALFNQTPTDNEIIRKGLEKACAPLFENITTTLRYYIAENRSTRINKVLVCGSLALSGSFIELLEAQLSIKATSWNPVAEMPCEMDAQRETRLKENGPLMAVAAGLAMRTI